MQKRGDTRNIFGGYYGIINFFPNFIDIGTLAMLSVIDFLPSDKVLDLGCGYGVVGILAGKLIGEDNVVMCDISERVVEYSKINVALMMYQTSMSD